MTRLASVFKVSEYDLGAQHMNLQPYAQRVFNTSGDSSVNAWAIALGKVRHRNMRDVHASDAIGPVLQKLIAWNGCCTSGVERGLGTVTEIQGKRREKLLLSLLLGELKICTDIEDNPEVIKDVIKRARKIWTETWAEPRTKHPTLPRFSGGAKQKLRSAKRSKDLWGDKQTHVAST